MKKGGCENLSRLFTEPHTRKGEMGAEESNQKKCR